MSKKANKPDVSINNSTENITSKSNKQRDIDFIFQQANNAVDEKISNKTLDRQIEIIKLIGGGEINIPNYISVNLIEYHSRFPKTYFQEIARLNLWDYSLVEKYYKPRLVALCTKQFVYGRFPNKILSTLEKLNPFVLPGLRLNKHFQRLSKSGEDELDSFIADIIRVMKTCSSWPEFSIKYTKETGLPLQMEMLFNA